MDLFETQSVINEDTFKSLKKHLLLQLLKRSVIFIVISIGLFILAIWQNKIASTMKNVTLYFCLLSFLVVILACVFPILELRNYVQVNMKRLREMAHNDECLYTTSFDESGFKIINHETNGTMIVYYDDIAKFIEIEKSYIIMTKLNQFGLINKIVIEESGKKEELIDYLKIKCLHIRFKTLS